MSIRLAVWSPIAERELDDILYHIAIDDGRELTAQNVLVELQEAINHHAAKELPGRKHQCAPRLVLLSTQTLVYLLPATCGRNRNHACD